MGSQKKSFEKWINFGLLPIIFALTGFGISTLGFFFVQSAVVLAIIFSALLIFTYIFETKIFAILTFAIILIPIGIKSARSKSQSNYLSV